MRLSQPANWFHLVMFGSTPPLHDQAEVDLSSSVNSELRLAGHPSFFLAERLASAIA